MKELFASVKDNLAFLGICVLIFAALFLVALLFEKLLLKNQRRVSPARYISYVAMFSALAGVLMLLEIPLFFAPSFYKLDLSEIPVLICTFFLGPVAGVVTEFLKVFLKLLFKSTSTANARCVQCHGKKGTAANVSAKMNCIPCHGEKEDHYN